MSITFITFTIVLHNEETIIQYLPLFVRTKPAEERFWEFSEEEKLDNYATVGEGALNVFHFYQRADLMGKLNYLVFFVMKRVAEDRYLLPFQQVIHKFSDHESNGG